LQSQNVRGTHSKLVESRFRRDKQNNAHWPERQPQTRNFRNFSLAPHRSQLEALMSVRLQENTRQERYLTLCARSGRSNPVK